MARTAMEVHPRMDSPVFNSTNVQGHVRRGVQSALPAPPPAPRPKLAASPRSVSCLRWNRTRAAEGSEGAPRDASVQAQPVSQKAALLEIEFPLMSLVKMSSRRSPKGSAPSTTGGHRGFGHRHTPEQWGDSPARAGTGRSGPHPGGQASPLELRRQSQAGPPGPGAPGPRPDRKLLAARTADSERLTLRHRLVAPRDGSRRTLI